MGEVKPVARKVGTNPRIRKPMVVAARPKSKNNSLLVLGIGAGAIALGLFLWFGVISPGINAGETAKIKETEKDIAAKVKTSGDYYASRAGEGEEFKGVSVSFECKGVTLSDLSLRSSASANGKAEIKVLVRGKFTDPADPNKSSTKEKEFTHTVDVQFGNYMGAWRLQKESEDKISSRLFADIQELIKLLKSST